MGEHKSNWSELSTDLIVSIASLLETRDDLRCFRAVCKNWRVCSSMVPYHNLPYLSPFCPYKFLSKPNESSIPLTKSTISSAIVANSTFLLQPKNTSLKPWLITVEERDPGTLLLRQPLTMVKFSDFSKVLNLSDCNVILVQRGYDLRFRKLRFFCYSTIWRPCIVKVVLLFNPASASVDDCFALATMFGDRYIIFAKLNDSKDNEGQLCADSHFAFDDIVNYKGSVWAIDSFGRVYVIHYSDNLQLLQLSSDYVSEANTQRRLVESCDGLYMIHMINYDELISFRVYKLDEKEFRWNEIKSLGDRILFVLSDYCFFRPAKDFPGCRTNCIFFHKSHFGVKSRRNNLFFNGDIKELDIRVFYLDDGESGLLSSYPGYSDIFWPPPKWLFPEHI